MRDLTVPTISKWPFFLGDILLVGLAFAIYSKSISPMGMWQIFACVLCVALGAVSGIIPFLTEYRAATRLAEADRLVSATGQIRNVEQLASQIGHATSQWQAVRESADKTEAGAREIAQRMAAEVKAFNEFIQRANEDEKATLRLEVDKLRRAEGDWLQVLVRILDHVYALHHAATRSRQPGVAEQLKKFQLACHDAARRIGLMPFVAAPDDPFNDQRHQLVDPNATPPAGALIEHVVANGYTFQGKLIRPALVHLRGESASADATEPDVGNAASAPSPQTQLPLEPDHPGTA